MVRWGEWSGNVRRVFLWDVRRGMGCWGCGAGIYMDRGGNVDGGWVSWSEISRRWDYLCYGYGYGYGYGYAMTMAMYVWNQPRRSQCSRHAKMGPRQYGGSRITEQAGSRAHVRGVWVLQKRACLFAKTAKYMG
jgi:hypothetical protein